MQKSDKSEEPIETSSTDSPLSYERFHFVADPRQRPLRVDRFLMDRLERTSRSKIQDAIHNGDIKVNDKQVKPNAKIKPGDVIAVDVPRSLFADFKSGPEEMELDIRYEDDDVLVLHKPPGLVVHPGVGNWHGTLINGLMYYFQQQGGQEIPTRSHGGDDYPGLVHRIDKDTSGLMVIAKSRHAMTHLAKQFYDHTIYRRYVAIVWGEPEQDEGTVIGNVGRNPRDPIRFMVHTEADKGKHAVTHYKVLERLYYVSMIECRLETGRTHQIRVHMKHLGHTLFGDPRYGGNRILKGTVYSKYKQFVTNTLKGLPRQALHAKSIGFVHPTTGEEMIFHSELPDDMQQVMERWRRYLAGRRKE